jgi:hypothetical protein
MKHFKISFLAITMLVGFLSCGKDEVSSDCSNQVLTGNLDGMSWTASEITQATIFKGIDPLTGKPAYRLDLAAKAKDGSSLRIVVNEFEKGLHGDCMDQNKTWSTNLGDNYFDPVTFASEIAIFTFTTADNKIYLSTLEGNPGTFEFSQCDASKKTISGKFNFNYEIIDDEVEIIKFSNGVFENICFTIL